MEKNKMNLTNKIGKIAGSIVVLAGLTAYGIGLVKESSDWEIIKSRGEAFSYDGPGVHQVVLVDKDGDGSCDTIEELRMYGPLPRALAGVSVRDTYGPKNPRFNQVLEDVDRGKLSGI